MNIDDDTRMEAAVRLSLSNVDLAKRITSTLSENEQNDEGRGSVILYGIVSAALATVLSHGDGCGRQVFSPPALIADGKRVESFVRHWLSTTGCGVSDGDVVLVLLQATLVAMTEVVEGDLVRQIEYERAMRSAPS